MRLVNKIKLLVIFAVLALTSLTMVACGGNVGAGNGANVELDEFTAVVPERYNEYTDENDGTKITVDGVLNDNEWNSQNAWVENVLINGYQHEVTVISRFTEDGVIMAYRVIGDTAYFNPKRTQHNNSGIEMYIANGQATDAYYNQYEIDLFGNSTYSVGVCMKALTVDGYKTVSTYLDVKGRYIDEAGDTVETNDLSNVGYEIEAMLPWSVFGGKTDSILQNVAIIHVATNNAEKRTAYVNMLQVLEGDSYWMTCQSWRRFDKDGYYDKTKSEFSISPYDVGVKATNGGFAITGKGWNKGTSLVGYNEKITSNEFFVSTKLFAPHLAHEVGTDGYNEMLEKVTNQNSKDSGKGTETGLAGIRLMNNGYIIQVSLQKNWDKGVNFRWDYDMFKYTSIKLSASQLEKYMSTGLTIGMYVKDSTVYPFIENGETGDLEAVPSMVKELHSCGIEQLKEFSAKFAYICDAKFENFTLLQGNELNGSVNVVNQTEASANGTVTAAGRIMGDLVVEITPFDGYQIDKLYVNGEDKAMLVDNNKLTLKSYNSNKCVVKATFKSIVGTLVTANVTRKFAYETESYSAVGAALTFTCNDMASEYYEEVYSAAVNELGKISLYIPNGTFAVTSAGYMGFTATVENGAFVGGDIVLLRRLFNDIGNAPHSANYTGEGTADGVTLATTVTDGAQTPLDSLMWRITSLDFSKKIVLTYTFSIDITKTTNCFAEIRYANTTTANGKVSLNQGDWRVNQFRDAPNNKWDYPEIHTDPVNYMLVIEGTSWSLYIVEGSSARLVATWNVETATTCIIFSHGQHTALFSWSNIKAYDNERATTYLGQYGL